MKIQFWPSHGIEKPFNWSVSTIHCWHIVQNMAVYKISDIKLQTDNTSHEQHGNSPMTNAIHHECIIHTYPGHIQLTNRLLAHSLHAFLSHNLNLIANLYIYSYISQSDFTTWYHHLQIQLHQLYHFQFFPFYHLVIFFRQYLYYRQLFQGEQSPTITPSSQMSPAAYPLFEATSESTIPNTITYYSCHSSFTRGTTSSIPTSLIDSTASQELFPYPHAPALVNPLSSNYPAHTSFSVLTPHSRSRSTSPTEYVEPVKFPTGVPWS